METRRGFSLVEVTLAIGIIGFALVAILALMPVGMNSSRDAIDATHTSLIAQDLENRIKSSVTRATFSNTTDVILGPWFYDRNAVVVDTAANGFTSVIYRADATVHAGWGTNAAPASVDANFLRPVTVSLGWPVSSAAPHTVIGNNSVAFTFYVRKP